MLDKDKVDDLFYGNKFNLFVESNGVVFMLLMDIVYKMVFLNGVGYFFFYLNVVDVFYFGDKVLVVIDAVCFEYFEVKS